MNTKVKGYILGAVAAATYGMNPLFTLPLYREGMNPDSVLFFRYLFAIPILGIMLKARGRSFSLKRKEILPLVILGWLVAISSLTLFQSYNYMEAGIASTILFVYPILVALIMAVAFKEKVTLQTVLCIFLALSGIGLLYKGGDGTTLSLVGVGLVMASALSYAIYIVGVNRPILKDVATLKVTFYVLLFGLSLFLVRVDFGQSLHVVDKWYLWGNLIALAIFPTLYDASRAIHRFYSYGYPWSFGTCHGCILRSNDLRGKPDTEIVLRNCIDHHGCDVYYSRKQYYDAFGTVQEVVSTITAEAPKKIDKTSYLLEYPSKSTF